MKRILVFILFQHCTAAHLQVQIKEFYNIFNSQNNLSEKECLVPPSDSEISLILERPFVPTDPEWTILCYKE